MSHFYVPLPLEVFSMTTSPSAAFAALYFLADRDFLAHPPYIRGMIAEDPRNGNRWRIVGDGHVLRLTETGLRDAHRCPESERVAAPEERRRRDDLRFVLSDEFTVQALRELVEEALQRKVVVRYEPVGDEWLAISPDEAFVEDGQQQLCSLVRRSEVEALGDLLVQGLARIIVHPAFQAARLTPPGVRDGWGASGASS